MPAKVETAACVRASVLMLALGLGMAGMPPATAQSGISTEGAIESKSGGMKFPDGSVQSGAAVPMGECPTMDPNDEMIWVGGVCIDKYEASLWDAPVGGNQITGTIPCSDNGQDCDNIWARSVVGVQPRRTISWLQAQAALANSGKRLPTIAEWQIAAAGTPDPGETPGSEDCNTNSSFYELTGERTNCFSRWGHHDMVGNVIEWVADWRERAADCQNWSESFGSDTACIGEAEGDFTTHRPSPVIRDGARIEGADAGVFAVRAAYNPDDRVPAIGFRGAR